MVVYSVSQITSYLKELLERDSVMRDLWISGEVTNLARSGPGHSYFSLRDSDGSLRCVMFRGGRGADLPVFDSLNKVISLKCKLPSDDNIEINVRTPKL